MTAMRSTRKLTTLPQDMFGEIQIGGKGVPECETDM
jgi:hypothetical protein